MSDMTLVLRLRADGTAEVVGAAKAVQSAVTGAGTAAETASRRQGNAAQAAATAQGGLAQAHMLAARAATALGAALSVTQIIKWADTWKEVEGRLRLVTSGTAELMAVQEQLFKVAQDTRQGYEATSDTYSRFARATQGLGVSQAQLLAVTETIGKAVTISGGSAASAEAALFQLGQAMAAGTLRGEELNSVLEQAPRLAQAIAAGMGTTVGQLRTLAEAGKLTSEAVLKALLSQGKVVSDEFEQLEPTVAGAFTKLQNAVLKYVGEADRASGASHALAGGVSSLAKNLDTAVSAAGWLGAALAGAMAGRSFGPTIQGMARTAEATAQAAGAAALLRTQTLAGAQASAEAAARRVAEVAGAQSQVAILREQVVRQRDAATAQMELTRGMAEATGRTQPYVKALEARNEQTRTLITYGRLERQLTAEATAAAGAKAAADAAVVRAQGDIAAATARTGLAARAAAAATSLLGGALALVGGPVGAVILGTALAVGYLATRTSDAERVQAAYNTTLAEGRKRTEDLATASRGRANQLMEEQRNAVSAAHAEAAALRAKVAATRDEIAALRELSASNGGMPGITEGAEQQVRALQAKLAEAEARIQAATTALDAMQSVSQTTGDAVGLEFANGIGRGSKAVASFTSRLTDALKAAGQTAVGSRALTDEQAELEQHTQTLTTVTNAGVGAFAKYGVSATDAANTLELLRLKLDPVRRAIADLNAETNLLHIPEGFEREWAALVTKMSKGGERLLTPEEILQARKDLTDNAAAKLDDTAAKAEREAVAQKLLAGALTDAAKAHANNRVALADAAAKYPGLGAETAKTLLTTKDFAGELAKLPPGFQRLWTAMSSSANSQLAASAASAAQGMSAETKAAELMAAAAGKGEAAQRRARIEAEVYAAALQGHAAATRAAAEAQEAFTVVQIRADQTAAIEEQIRAQELLTAAYAKGPATVQAVELAEKARTLALKEAEEGTDAYTAAYAHYLGLLQKGAEAERALAAAQAEQTARRDLSDAQAELALMREAEPVRARALESIRIQRQAVDLFGDATSAAARDWITLQEQIADTRATVKYWEDVRRVSEEVSGDIAENLYDSLMDPDQATSVVDFFRSIFKRLAVEALKTQIVMPIVTQVVGSAPGLFGIASGGGSGGASGAAGASGTTTGGVSVGVGDLFRLGSLTSQSGLGGFDTSFLSGGWLDRQLGGSLTGVNTWLNSPIGGYEALPAGQFGPPAPASGVSWGNALGAVGYGFNAFQNFKSGNVVGGIGNTAASVMMFIPGAQPFAPFVAIGSQILGGLFGNKQPSNKEGNATVSLDDWGVSVDGQGGSKYSQENRDAAKAMAEGVGQLARTLETALSVDLSGGVKVGVGDRDGIYAERGGQRGEFARDENGQKELVRWVAQRLAEEAGDQLPPAFGAAIRSIDWSDTERALADLDFITQIKNGVDAVSSLKDVDKSLTGLTAAAKEAQTAALAPMIEQFEKAKGFGLVAEFASVVAPQIRQLLDGLTNPTAYTATETAIANLAGQMDALREASDTLGLGLRGVIDTAQAAALANLRDSYLSQVEAARYDAQGRGYLNQLATTDASRATTTRDLTALGVADAAERAADLVDEQLRAVLRGLSADQLADAAGTLTGRVSALAAELLSAARAADTATATQGLAARALAASADGRLIQSIRDVLDQQQADGLVDGAQAVVVATAALREAAAGAGELRPDQLAAVRNEFARTPAALAALDEALATTAATATAAHDAAIQGLAARALAASADGRLIQSIRDVLDQQQADGLVDGAQAVVVATAALREAAAGAGELRPDQLAAVRNEFARTPAALAALDEALAATAAAADEAATAARQSEATEVLASRVTTARGAYLDALTREQAILRDTASRLREVGVSLASLRASLALDSTLSPLSAQARLAEAKRQLQAAVDEFRSTGDADAGTKAQQLMDSYLRASRDYNSSAPAYQADYDWVIGLTTELEGLATTTADAKDDQARALDATVAALGGTTSAVLSLTDALARYTDAVRLSGTGAGAQDFGDSAVANDNRIVAAATVQSGNGYTGAFRDGAFSVWAQATYAAHANDQGVGASVNAMLRASTGYTGDFRDGAFVDYVRSSAVTELQREAARSILRRNNVVPQFQDGGFHAGGARIVGERGIELEVTGAARYYSHDQTRDLLAPRPAADLTPLVSAVTGSAATISRAVTTSGEAVTLAIGQMAADLAGMRAELADSRREIRDLTRIVGRLAA